MNEVKLKKYLKKIKENDFLLTKDIDLEEITEKMLEFIGTTDPVLRDELIYVTFYNWIVGDKVIYSDQKLREIAKIAIDNQHLLYKLGDKETDSVFTRAFSALLCALIIHVDRERHYLTEVQFHQIKEALFKYLKEEKDIRGFVPVKGWAHSVAHGADAIEELIYYDYLSEDDLCKLLDIVRDKMITNDSAYICQEDERMVNPVVAVFKQKIMSESKIFTWLDSFNDIENDCDFVEDRFAIHNIKIFLKSLYFKVLEEELLNDSILKKIEKVILKTR